MKDYQVTKIINPTFDLVEQLLSILLETNVVMTSLSSGNPYGSVITIKIPEGKESLLSLLAIKYGVEVNFEHDQIQLTFPLTVIKQN